MESFCTTSKHFAPVLSCVPFTEPHKGQLEKKNEDEVLQDPAKLYSGARSRPHPSKDTAHVDHEGLVLRRMQPTLWDTAIMSPFPTGQCCITHNYHKYCHSVKSLHSCLTFNMSQIVKQTTFFSNFLHDQMS